MALLMYSASRQPMAFRVPGPTCGVRGTGVCSHHPANRTVASAPGKVTYVPAMRPDYLDKPVYSTIAQRFLQKYRIHLERHIGAMLSVAALEGIGIDFVPLDASLLTLELS